MLGLLNPGPPTHPFLNIHNEIGKECVLNLFLQSIICWTHLKLIIKTYVSVEQTLRAGSRGAAQNETGMVPALSNWLLFGTDGRAGHFFVRVKICHCSSLHPVATWRYFLPTLYQKLIHCMCWAMWEVAELKLQFLIHFLSSKFPNIDCFLNHSNLYLLIDHYLLHKYLLCCPLLARSLLPEIQI